MSSSEQTRAAAGRARAAIAVVLALAVAAVIGAVLGYQVVSAQSWTGSPVVLTDGDSRGTDAAHQSRTAPVPDLHVPSGRTIPGGVTVEDGVVPDGVTVWDDEYPAVANLDPDLLSALRQAASAAADDGVRFSVTSGWRSAAYQDQLLRDAVAEYGSAEEAARWVATAETSLHVSGDAVDLGPSDATVWLSEHGSDHGLCQIYGNEPWHYELRPGAVDRGCPAPYADPTHDPRLQR